VSHSASSPSGPCSRPDPGHADRRRQPAHGLDPPDVTVGLEDVSTYPALFAELLARGWTEPDCAALAGGNLLRALRAAESAASGS
jgi:microsomal dipeptidase-like Zn-dependent dipeptidase